MSFDQTASGQHSLAPTEEEMSQVGNLFDRMRNAIIDASHLAGEVAELRKAVSELRSEVEVVRRDNHYLTEQVNSLRTARDHAVAEASAQVTARQAAEHALAAEVAAHDVTKSLHSQAVMDLFDAKRSRDDEAYRNLELSEELEKVKGQLAKIREAMGLPAPSTVVEMPKAATIDPPKPQEPPPVQATGSDWPRGGW